MSGSIAKRSQYWASGLRRITCGMVLLTLFCIGTLSLISCDKSGQNSKAPVAALAKARLLPTDFVVCIDNSGSISPSEQELVRETTMLLADLADIGDHISVITFGNSAKVNVSVQIRSDADRLAFRQQVRAAVNFKENYSDIRAGLRTLTVNRSSLLRPAGQSNRAVIILSDGKLEPGDGKTSEAFDQMLADIRGPLSDLAIYTVVLGDKASRDRILERKGQPITGQTLLGQYVAQSASRYYHALSLNQVTDAVVHILNDTKGISSLGEQGTTRFRIDDTVDSMSFIVRKKSADGRQLCNSSDILIKGPVDEPITIQNFARQPGGYAYWNQEYQFFDLIIFRKPKPGIWEVQLSNKGTPELLSKVVSPIELRLDRRDVYYLNESANIAACLFDRREALVSKAPYRLQAHIAKDGDLKGSNTFLPLISDAATGQYFLQVPADLNKALGLNNKGGSIRIEFIAEKRKSADSKDLDPWFIRRSVPFTISLVEPFATWAVQKQTLTRVPVFGSLISYPNPFDSALVPFGAVVDPKAPNYPVFLLPPRLTLELKRADTSMTVKETQSSDSAIEAIAANNKFVYSLTRKLGDAGTYEYSYRLAGNTEGGPFSIDSPKYTISIRYGFEFLALFSAFLLCLLYYIADRSAKLSGQVAFEEGKLQTLRKKVEYVEDGTVKLQLTARCFFFVVKKIDLRVIKGQALVKGKRLAAGNSVSLVTRKRHTVVLMQDDGTQTNILIHVAVRIL
jgi:hypothetical protein